jgi:hypothetical protein
VERARFAVWEIGAVAAALSILLLVMINRYGPHRDELYFVAAGQRLAWGYPDQPVFTPLLARLATELAPHNLLVLRLPSLMAMALLVLCAAAFARLLGGGRAAQVLTASTIAASRWVIASVLRPSTRSPGLPCSWLSGMRCTMIGRGCGSLLVYWPGWA